MMVPVATAMPCDPVACPHRGTMGLFGGSIEYKEDGYRSMCVIRDVHAMLPVVSGDAP